SVCVTVSHFLFMDAATSAIFPLSLHDALPILSRGRRGRALRPGAAHARGNSDGGAGGGPAGERLDGRTGHEPLGRRSLGHGREADRKSTRLNSSHVKISYAVFCLKKKNKICLT